MDENEIYQIEHLLPEYFSGKISDADREKVDHWKSISEENQHFLEEMSAVWESGEILAQMQQFDAKKALKKIDRRFTFDEKTGVKWQSIQKVAAVLLLPLLIYSGILTFFQLNKSNLVSEVVAWQKVQTTTGMVSEMVLPDGSKVWLNSGTTLEYPLGFENSREVILVGEAYFEVKEDKNHPFVVNTGTINVEVLGTSFNVTNFPDEGQTEIVLASGKVQLFTGERHNKSGAGFLSPGQLAVFHHTTKELFVNNVVVAKYTAWKDGVLMFIDDPMNEVVKKLSRRFNVDFVLESSELEDYVYRATFKNESLAQVLDLLKLSAPIEYTMKPRQLLSSGNYTREKVIIRKR